MSNKHLKRGTVSRIKSKSRRQVDDMKADDLKKRQAQRSESLAKQLSKLVPVQGEIAP
jgi:hypothetical protein